MNNYLFATPSFLPAFCHLRTAKTTSDSDLPFVLCMHWHRFLCSFVWNDLRTCSFDSCILFSNQHGGTQV